MREDHQAAADGDGAEEAEERAERFGEPSAEAFTTVIRTVSAKKRTKEDLLHGFPRNEVALGLPPRFLGEASAVLDM